MKRIQLLILIILVITSLSSCKIGSKGGTLYITDETFPGAEISVVKILEHTYNQSTEKNIFSDYNEKISYGGYTWYAYDIPDGSRDVYIEYYKDGDFINEREEVYIEGGSSGNEWAAVWLLDYNSVSTEQGSGSLSLTSSLFN